MIGIILGFIGFRGAPLFRPILTPYDQTALGGSAVLFVYRIFINVRPCLRNNSMWRSQNPDIRKHLFAHDKYSSDTD